MQPLPCTHLARERPTQCTLIECIPQRTSNCIFYCLSSAWQYLANCLHQQVIQKIKNSHQRTALKPLWHDRRRFNSIKNCNSFLKMLVRAVPMLHLADDHKHRKATRKSAWRTVYQRALLRMDQPGADASCMYASIIDYWFYLGWRLRNAVHVH